MRGRSAFTLVEIMIVVSVICLVALMGLPSFLRARQRSQNARFINELRLTTNAFELYATEHNGYPPDTATGVLPAGMASYFGPTFDFTAPTPIGGNWDWDTRQFGVVAGVSVMNPDADDTQMSDIDTAIDDGDLTTGGFRKTGGARYTSILE